MTGKLRSSNLASAPKLTVCDIRMQQSESVMWYSELRLEIDSDKW